MTATTTARPRTAQIVQYLVVYDEPQVVLLKSWRDHNMIGVAIGSFPEMERPFFACEARDKAFDRYLDGKADLHYVFHQSMNERYYFFDLDAEKDDRVTLKPAPDDEAKNESYWPRIGFFARSHTNPYRLRALAAAAIQRFKIDGNWGAEDFSHFHARMSDLYALFAALNRADANRTAELTKIKSSIQEKFWQGGSSYVSFYDDLLKGVSAISPLDVAGIQYASPGEIRLRGDKNALSDVSRIVEIFDLHDRELRESYLQIYNALRKDKLLRAPKHQEFSSKALEAFVSKETFAFANSMQIEKANEIFSACDRNVAIFAKVILSVYRRASALYAFHAEGRVQAVDAES